MSILLTGESIDFGVRYDFEANKIHDNLWQGSYPPVGEHVGDAGFKLLVLCASEYQPPGRKFPDVDVWHAPFEDNSWLPPSRETLEVAMAAAEKAAGYVRKGQNVLITCWAGINRSSLVTALTLYKLLGLKGTDLIKLIQLQRPGTLSNGKFRECLARLDVRL
jgi:hypothetical protein